MRKVKADFIYTLAGPPVKNGILLLDKKGIVEKVVAENEIDYTSSLENAEIYSGIICPGFVNTHCHLELSYLSKKIDEKTGLSGFVSQLQKTRNQFKEIEIQEAIVKAEASMISNGIVAVGDICNGTLTLEQKLKGKLYYHSFVELFAFDEQKANEVFERGKKIYETFNSVGLSASITPHAPYSTSEKLMHLIATHCGSENKILSIHNQESEEENKLFQNKSGKMAEMLLSFGFDLSQWKQSKTNSLPHYLPFLQTVMPLLLVHNTYSTANDIAAVNRAQLYWCICANANLYIENALPNIPELVRQNACLTLGTDSLASNHQLSIWDEIKTIRTHFPQFALEELLKWACLNGARYMGIEKFFGTLEAGKKPGINWIEFPDSPHSTVKKLH